MQGSQIKVCVVGAGIIGLPTAVNVIESIPNIHVTLISEEFSPNTTGDGSAGIWEPYLVSGTPEHLLKRWGQETFTHLATLANSCEAWEAGTFLLGGYKVFSRKPVNVEMPYWKDTVFGFHEMTHDELRMFPESIKYGWGYTSAVAECTKYLPWLTKRFRRKGGLIEKRKIHHIEDLCGQYDIVLNCTGLGARECANDLSLTALRGQVMRIKAPWMKMFIWMEDEGLYLLPNGESIVLGGTHDEDEWDTTPDPKVRQHIWEGCLKILPQLKDAVHLQDWSGLRPKRLGIRLELELLKSANGQMEVIHNYGHGGSGVTLHWGCAMEAARLCRQAVTTIRERNKDNTLSKL